MEKFGVEHAPSTIDRYRVKPKGDPGGSQKWRTFLKNNIDGIWSCDFFVQYTVGFRALHVLVIMELKTRNVLHFGITENPSLEWTKQQIRNVAFDRELPKFLIHDNDGRFGQYGTSRTVTDGAGEAYSVRSSLAAWLWETMGVKSVPIPYGAPNANAHCERMIGTTRRECLEHLIIWNARHLHKVLTEFYCWYREARPHLGINGIPEPDPALAEPRPELGEGKVVAHPILGGLHHDYRIAA
jgi:transposase InsO family protein